LAIGTDSGSIIFYNRETQRKVPCISKHGKKVISGDWHQNAAQGLLMTCSEDRLLTISDYKGDTLEESFFVNGEPTQLTWCPAVDQTKRIICAIIGAKQLIILDTPTQKDFIINFNSSYGKVVCYQWIGEDSIAVGFSNGIVSLVSVKTESMGIELHTLNTGVKASIDVLSICSDL
jgi:hypothetical protein